MPITLPLSKMSRREKLMAMETLWTDLSSDDAKVDSPVWHADALKETERLVRSGKAKFMDWDEAKALLRRKAAKLA
jgi:Putative addiction module component